MALTGSSGHIVAIVFSGRLGGWWTVDGGRCKAGRLRSALTAQRGEGRCLDPAVGLPASSPAVRLDFCRSELLTTTFKFDRDARKSDSMLDTSDEEAEEEGKLEDELRRDAIPVSRRNSVWQQEEERANSRWRTEKK
ncbi:hypothetical protein F2P81_022466 [Scophthalmus maximus]|uniref:Uncharacterized protein n=1 Tax=Scophthalmus maximus TaxID=52904 RepID=A0A6A4S025_SCOMX|nr:hypothetical protein F2P81_022466 [Scophthalmus maximus]